MALASVPSKNTSCLRSRSRTDKCSASAISNLRRSALASTASSPNQQSQAIASIWTATRFLAATTWLSALCKSASSEARCMAGMLAVAFPGNCRTFPTGDAGQTRTDGRKTCNQVRLSVRTGKVLANNNAHRPGTQPAPGTCECIYPFCEKAPGTASAGLLTAWPAGVGPKNRTLVTAPDGAVRYSESESCASLPRWSRARSPCRPASSPFAGRQAWIRHTASKPSVQGMSDSRQLE